MRSKSLQVTLKINSYIAQPYWPELDEVVNIQKKSGYSMARTEAKREQNLKSYLDKIGMKQSEYDDLVKRSQRKWYTNENNLIIIPRHHLAGCLIQSLNTAPKTVKAKYNSESFRALVQLSDFVTTRKQCDEIFDRYVKSDMSHQRRRTISEVITNFEAKGTITIDADHKVSDLEFLLNHALAECGVGSSRKMGYGRGTVQEIKEG